jgi:hypothetical protein
MRPRVKRGGAPAAPPGGYVEALQETIRRQNADLDFAWAEISRLKESLRDARHDSDRLRKLANAATDPRLDAWVLAGKEGRTWEVGRTGGQCYVFLRASGGVVERASGGTPDAARRAMAQKLSTEHLKTLLPLDGFGPHGDT